MFDVNERLEKTINYLKENNVELLYPCHCVSLNAKIEMAKKINICEVGVGMKNRYLVGNIFLESI